MGEYIAGVILQFLIGIAVDNTKQYISTEIQKFKDYSGKISTTIVGWFDTTGDGQADTSYTLAEIENIIPEFINGYCLCDNGDDVGLGIPEYRIVDNFELAEFIDIDEPITLYGDGILTNMGDDRGTDDVLLPIGADVTGDGYADWAWIVDDNNNGLPDVSPVSPFLPIGSPEYERFLSDNLPEPSIVVMSSDGTMTVYNRNGDITEEDCDTAYNLWISKNGIMNKPLDGYTVTEGILLLGFGVAVFAFFRKIFRRKKVV